MGLNSKFYTKPLGMIPFYIPHAGCPQQCIFCNQHRIAAHEAPAFSVDIDATIDEYIGSKRDEKYWEVAFYGGSFTALPADLQESLLKPAYEALKAGRIDGIRCSTRPDALEQDAIDRLKAYGVSTVEIGVQSMDDDILRNSKRGHTSDQVVEAVGRLKENHIKVGIQLLPGLPGETWKTLVHTAVAIANTEPDFGRIYPVLVIEDTELADQVKDGTYTPLSTEQAVVYSAFLKTYLESKGIYIIRTGLQSTEELDNGVSLVGGPYEPAMGEMVINRQWRLRIEEFIEKYAHECQQQTVIISYARSLTSKVRGLKRSNYNYFNKMYPQFTWKWEEDRNLHDEEHIYIYIDNVKYML
ncbi:radical SAM protein [Veillonella sp.]|uniref:elongator complex protein 3 n=1 Tax=Veillonella sp. TaxID=1926307 RepID=UPI0025D9C119|nr:radical SAM protein [Veillonella sp.]